MSISKLTIILFGLIFLGKLELSYAEEVPADLFRDQIPKSSLYVSADECSKLEKSYSSKKNKLNFSTFFTNRTREEVTYEFFNSELVRRLGVDDVAGMKLTYFKLARCENQIDDIVFGLFKTYFSKLSDEEKAAEQDVSPFYQSKIHPSMPLMEYLDKKKAMLKLTKKKDIAGEVNPFSLDNFYALNGSQKISMQERLYAMYSPSQINKMSQVMNFILNVMDASKVETTIHFQDDLHQDNYVIDHTASDIYRLSLSILQKERKKLIYDNGKTLPFTPMDVLVASYEMGVISSTEIEMLTKDPTFFKKDVSMLKKITNYITRLGLTAAQINPTTAPYALVAMIIYNSYQDMHDKNERVEYEDFYFPSEGNNQ